MDWKQTRSILNSGVESESEPLKSGFWPRVRVFLLTDRGGARSHPDGGSTFPDGGAEVPDFELPYSITRRSEDN